MALFFLVLSDPPLPGCTTVPVSTHRLKDISVASRLWQLQSCCKHPRQVCVDVSFQFIWENTKEQDFRIVCTVCLVLGLFLCV